MSDFKLFTLGAMSEGMVHHSLIENFVTAKTPARIRGQVYRLEVGYPVLMEEGNDWVEGTLFDLSVESSPNTLMALLDEFHGVHLMDPIKGMHYRSVCHVNTTTEPSVRASTYYFNPKKLSRAAVYIDGGFWRESMQSLPVLTERISDEQKRYIRRLGKTKGREIVPINMQLYRELMSLELIVDKGRRLALSKLGKEVFRYLD